MLRALCLSLTLLALPVSADAGPKEGANAALTYWRAFATLPKFSEAETQKLTAEYLTMPLDAHAREIVNNAEYSLGLMHAGAVMPRCNWGIDWELEGVDARLPYLVAARVLSTVACLRARLHFAEGRPAEAIADILAARTLGRHASVDGSLIAVLVGYAIDARTGEALALDLPRLDAPMVKKLQAGLDALPAGGSQATALMACEATTLEWFMRRVKAAPDEKGLLAVLTFMGLAEGAASDAVDKSVRAFLKECGGTAQGVLRFAEETRPAYPKIAKLLELPLDQFEKETEREMKQRASNPVFKVFFPAIIKSRRTQARAEVRRALLAAALAVQLEGRAALKNHPDPVAGGPFDYAPFAGGFELRSRPHTPGESPLELIVGRRGK